MAQVLENQIVKIPQAALKRGVVMLNLEEYEELRKRAVPIYYLKGKEAEGLDKLVEEGLREHREGKTIKAPSLRKALEIYDRKQNKKH